MQYKLVTASSATNLNSEVNTLLKEGWQLYGFPFGDSTNDFSCLCQGLVKVNVQEEMNRVSEAIHKTFSM